MVGGDKGKRIEQEKKPGFRELPHRGLQSISQLTRFDGDIFFFVILFAVHRPTQKCLRHVHPWSDPIPLTDHHPTHTTSATPPSPPIDRPTSRSIPNHPSPSAMTAPCFVPSLPVRPSLAAASSICRAPQPSIKPLTPRAGLDLIPGVPPGEDARENAPLRDYVPRPVETYEDRGFATVLPQNWAGETSSIGVADVVDLVPVKEDAREALANVDAAATGAFVEYAQMMREERQAELDSLKERSGLGDTGRATCGEEEGKAFVSNYRTVLVDGVKAVEYWGAPNGPVPRLFGWSSE